jgi:hypothetical protein
VAKIVTLDAVEALRVLLIRDLNRELRVHAEYNLKAGGRVVQLNSGDVTDRLGAGGGRPRRR